MYRNLIYHYIHPSLHKVFREVLYETFQGGDEVGMGGRGRAGTGEREGGGGGRGGGGVEVEEEVDHGVLAFGCCG